MINPAMRGGCGSIRLVRRIQVSTVLLCQHFCHLDTAILSSRHWKEDNTATGLPSPRFWNTTCISYFCISVFSLFVSSDRSSCSDDGLLYIRSSNPLFQIFTQSIDAIDVTSVTLSCLNFINAIYVPRC